VSKVTYSLLLSGWRVVTFGTAGRAMWSVGFTPMATIATITSIAGFICGLGLAGILWREAERADIANATRLQRGRIGERAPR
jgi:hypothetical protein